MHKGYVYYGGLYEGSDTPTKSVRDFEISGFHGRFRDFSEDFEISLEISRFPLRFRDFS